MSNKRTTIKRSESEWRKLYKMQEESGQSMTRFCRANGVAVSSYIKWKRRFDEESKPVVGKVSPILVERGRELELELPEGIKLRLSL